MPASRPLKERFAEKYVVDEATGCWLWTASTDTNGYGHISVGRKLRQAHRLSYEWSYGPIPDGHELDHTCRVRRCVNPDHLEPVIHRENVFRGEGIAVAHAAKTHCIHGHPFDEANTYYRHRPGSVERVCRACRNERSIAYRKRKTDA